MTKLTCSILSVASLLIVLAACSVPPAPTAAQAAANAKTPGWTGTTFVVGSTSTVEGDADATYLQQKWGVGRQR
jgi:hypothetical protein